MFPLKVSLVPIVSLLLFPTAVLAEPTRPDPQWWQEGNPPVIALGTVSNNSGPANIGQARWMTRCALDKLARLDPGIAKEIETLLIVPQPVPGSSPPANYPAILGATPAGGIL